MPKLRQKLQKWIYKGLLEKIEIKDIAGAYVIARRGLGFEERLPKNYRKLLEDKMRGRAESLQKSWRVPSVALAFSYPLHGRRIRVKAEDHVSFGSLKPAVESWEYKVADEV